MPVTTVDEYLSALEKSKLLAAGQLAQAQSLAGESSDAPSLARALARENLVSRWQAGTLLALGQRAQLRLGKYKLIERLGKGGMGTVFLAEHVTMNRRVALKIVPRAIAEDRASLDRFFAEARAIAALDHPNIVQAYSVDNEMDRYFIVMEYVDGQDLQQMVEAKGPLEFDRAADFIRQSAEGLAHAHARNLVHCDIKPSNLLVNNQGVVKILDLGLARLNQSDEPRGGAGEPAFGTVDYMAPEQGLGTTDFDHRADIYSLGCTLYFLLTGKPPFPEGSLAQRIVKHQTQEPRDILSLRPGTPVKLVEICKRMMAKQPEDRYQSVQEVSFALAPLLGLSPAAAVSAPRAVKAIDEAPSNGSGAGNDWLSGLTQSAGPSARLNGAGPVTARPSPAGASGKRAKKVVPARGIAGAFAGLAAFGRTKLAWFNTTKRKVLGAIIGMCALAAVAGVAAVPLMLAQTKPQPAAPVKSDDKPANDQDAATKTADSSADAPPASEPRPEPMPVPVSKFDTPKPKPPEKPKAVAKTAVKPPVKPPVKPAPVATPKPEKPVEVVKSVSIEGLATALDLPAGNKDFTEAVSLGKLDLPPGASLDVQLLGGDTIAKGNPTFELAKTGDGGLPAEINLVEKNKDNVKLAKIYLDGGECKFQWLEEPRDKANLLRFCGLQFVSGAKDKPHFTALMAPKTVPPLVVDTDAAVIKPRRLSRDFPLCDPSLLRLQIEALDKSMPKHQITVMEKVRPGRSGRGKNQEMELSDTPGDTVGVKGHAFVKLTKNKSHVTFQIAFDERGKDVLLEMQGFCDVSGKTIPFNSNVLQNADARIASVLMMNDSTKGKGVPAAVVQLAKTGKEEIKALGELMGELNQKASIPFRVYALVGGGGNGSGQEITIFQSGQIEASKEVGPKKKNNTKSNRQKDRIPSVDN